MALEALALFLKDELQVPGGPPVKPVVSSPVRADPTSRNHSWISSVSVFIIEARDLPAKDLNGFSDPFCKLVLGGDKFRTQIAYKTLNPKWKEKFEFFLYNLQEQILHIEVWDWDRGMMNDFMGEATVDLNGFEQNKTHDFWVYLLDHDGRRCGSLHLNVVVRGKRLLYENATANEAMTERFAESEIAPYNLRNTLKNFGDVGMVRVTVLKATSLRSTDFNGKSDPYCSVRLGHACLQTAVIKRTLTPEWNSILTFPITDIHSHLRITLLSKNPDTGSDFLGRVAIPLLRISNNEPRWYALKDETLSRRAKGSLMLKLEMVYNPIRAISKTFQPKEVLKSEFKDPFQPRIFLQNFNRFRDIIYPWLFTSQLTTMTWYRTLISLLIYSIIIAYSQLWMAPAGLAAFLFYNYVAQLFFPSKKSPTDSKVDFYYDAVAESFPADDQTDFGFSQQIRAVKKQVIFIQEQVQYYLDLCEKIKNLFTFNGAANLSYLAFGSLVLSASVLYFISVRWVIWIYIFYLHVNWFRDPKALNNNYALLDFLSRIPTNAEIRMYKEAPVRVKNKTSPNTRPN